LNYVISYLYLNLRNIGIRADRNCAKLKLTGEKFIPEKRFTTVYMQKINSRVNVRMPAYITQNIEN
jgi:hypothetical protein